MEKFDYVIVGAGPAGCVLANRLSENPKTRILLLESGPKDRHPFIHMPKGIAKIRESSKYMWPFQTYSDTASEQPRYDWMRGRTLGGSSAVNGMIYVRGQPADYDELATLTSEDWNWAHIGAAFKALERHNLAPRETRGTEGYLKVTSYPGDGGDNTLLEAVISAGEALGLERQEDINEPDDAEKIGYTIRTIHDGRRQSAAVAFLRPVMGRRNLVVRPGILVDRVIFDGTKAVGVEGLEHGRPVRFFGERIILSAGAIGSPAILQRSGVGSPELLGRLGIPVVAPSPEVGENMIEHTIINLQWRATGFSNNPRYRGLGAMFSGLRYFLTHTGPLANATLEVTGFFRTRPGANRPNAQILFGPHSFANSAQRKRTAEKAHGFMICTYPLRPRAKGHARIVSRDPSVFPKLVYDPFSDAEDRRELIEGVRFARKLAATKPLSDYTVEETRPGARAQTDEEILGALRKWVGPGFHAAGTCRMGADPASVVDPKTRVRGVQNLHVVDLSILPILTGGNTYGPVAAIAWRAADLMTAS